MSAAASMQTQTAKPQAVSNSKHAAMLLQRKCACGSPTSSLTGACPECQSKKRLQTQLSIGVSIDPREQQADRVADQVMRATADPAINNTPPRIQRFAGLSSGENSTAPTSVDRVLGGAGRPLDLTLQQDTGQRFGYDFSRVRVHSDDAKQSARDDTHTARQNIAFGAGGFAPGTHEGQRLIAHGPMQGKFPTQHERFEGERMRLQMEARWLRRDLRQSVGQPLDLLTRLTLQERSWLSLDTLSQAGGVAHDHRSLETMAEADALGESARSPTASGHSVPNAAPVPRPDFSSVRLHADAHARAATRRLGARAFTIGEHIYTSSNQLAARSPSDGGLLAHELSHVVQQRALGRQFMQPRLIVSGSDADILRFITLAEAAMGEDLEHDPVTGEITAIASLATPPTSPAFATAMHRIIDDPIQDAEAHFGVGQPRVAVGAFPQPSDMTGSTEQLIDMDDVEAIETGAPGNGLGKLAHELTENYTAHAAVPAAGVDQFPASHDAGLSAESDVAEDTVGPGRRVANVDTPAVGNTFTRVQDFENYYLVFDLTRNPVNNDFSVSRARQAPRANVSITVIDHFATGSAAIPAAGAAAIAAAAADVVANPSATVRIEGFTDSVGAAVDNVILSNQRADSGEAALRAAGVAGGRIHTVGEGETLPVAANDTEANRALNRRIIITVDRPGP